jgi:hypothetical protein
MNIELTIRANSLDEIAHIFAAKAATYPANFGRDQVNVEADAEPEKEAAQEEAPAPKSTRQRTRKSQPETSTKPGESPDSSTSSAGSSSPSDEKVTLDDLRAAAEPIMQAGKGREIQEMLLNKFGVRAFGPLPEEKYPDALAELQNLAA